jgi:hypothetical protein
MGRGGMGMGRGGMGGRVQGAGLGLGAGVRAGAGLGYTGGLGARGLWMMDVMSLMGLVRVWSIAVGLVRVTLQDAREVS